MPSYTEVPLFNAKHTSVYKQPSLVPQLRMSKKIAQLTKVSLNVADMLRIHREWTCKGHVHLHLPLGFSDQ